jgi:hypothetical protein
MRVSTFVRAAAIITLLYALCHTAGMPWIPVKGVAEQPVIDAMQRVRFVALGADRSYWDFYQGFGLGISGLVFFQAIMLWQIAPLVEKGVAGTKAIIVAQILGFVVNGVIIANYIFFLPAIFVAAIILCLTASLLPRRNHRQLPAETAPSL